MDSRSSLSTVSMRKKMSPPAQKAAAAKTQRMLKEMPLQELRQAHQMSQERMAELLHTKQANVSRIERRTDMYISTLHSKGGLLCSRSQRIIARNALRDANPKLPSPTATPPQSTATFPVLESAISSAKSSKFDSAAIGKTND